MNKTTKDFILILIGSFMFAIGINYFTIPNMLSEGGQSVLQSLLTIYLIGPQVLLTLPLIHYYY